MVHHPRAQQLLALLFLIGITTLSFKDFSQAQDLETEELEALDGVKDEIPSLDSEIEDFPAEDPAPLAKDEGWVEVEPSDLIPSDLTGKLYLVPYKVRRKDWGGSVSVAYSNFEPLYYEPDFYRLPYESVYSSPSSPLIELQFSVKYNMAMGSIGGEAAVGFFKAESESVDAPSELELIPIRLGANFLLDTLFLEPYVVPYVSGGGYIMKYTETESIRSFNGTTQVAPYVAAGLQFQIDWMDPASARDAYLEGRVQNSFLFVEGRKFFASSAAQDPDFETDLHIDGGVRVEF
ncbi:MAG: hypothetical protein KDD22_08235 [Bdellovibrionales bacterium]|nr:hypothetical protein [Bdellovibrionales bacterium]